jgi:hypothetical protein
VLDRAAIARESTVVSHAIGKLVNRTCKKTDADLKDLKVVGDGAGNGGVGFGRGDRRDNFIKQLSIANISKNLVGVWSPNPGGGGVWKPNPYRTFLRVSIPLRGVR